VHHNVDGFTRRYFPFTYYSRCGFTLSDLPRVECFCEDPLGDSLMIPGEEIASDEYTCIAPDGYHIEDRTNLYTCPQYGDLLPDCEGCAPGSLLQGQYGDLHCAQCEENEDGLYCYAGGYITYPQPCWDGLLCTMTSWQLCPKGHYCYENTKFNCTTGDWCIEEGLVLPGGDPPNSSPPGGCGNNQMLYTYSGLCHCIPGYYTNTDREGLQCEECPAGYTCPFLSDRRFPCDANMAPYAYCPPGTTERTGLLCPTGHTCNITTSTPCFFDGYYCHRGEKIICPIGTYCDPSLSSTYEYGLYYATDCPQEPGYYCVSAGIKDPRCPAGYACPSYNEIEACPDGTYCPPGSTEPITCASGYYSENTTVPCRQCPSNYYCPPLTTEPTPCPSNRACPAGSAAPQCPPGFYCPNATAIVPCPPYQHCPINATAPINCSAGQWFDAAAARCTTCDALYYCPYGTTTQIQCPIVGVICPTGSAKPVQCAPPNCPAGKGGGWSDALTSRTSCPPPADYCVDCKRFFYCPGGDRTRYENGADYRCKNNVPCSNTKNRYDPICSAGSYIDTDLKTCRGCPAGWYCPAASAYTAVCPAGNYLNAADECTTCPANSYCPTYHLVTECSPGDYCPANSMARTACPAGSFCTDPTTTRLCPLGTYCPPRSTSADPCPAGFFCKTSAVITPCNNNGSFCPNGSTEELPCPTGYACQTSNQSRACSAAGDYCPAGSAIERPCPAGFYCPNATVALTCSVPGQLCAPRSTAPTWCTAGTYCPSANDTRPCAPGSYCPTGSTVERPCPSGFYCPNTTAAITCSTPGQICPPRSTAPRWCRAGTYCPSVNETRLCSLGSYCPAGSASEAPCPTGTRCPLTNVSIACVTGSYCPAGSTTEHPCPAGFYCQRPNATAACTSGSYCPNRTHAEGPCPAGHYCPNTAVKIACSTPGAFCPPRSTAPGWCAAGTHCPSANTSIACRNGSYCPGNSTAESQCTPGWHCTNPSTRQPCRPYEHCPGGSQQPTQCSTENYTLNATQPCTRVPTGSSYNRSSHQLARCVAGEYCAGGSAAPYACRARQYCPDGATLQECPRGFYCPNTTTIAPCPANLSCPNGSTEPQTPITQLTINVTKSTILVFENSIDIPRLQRAIAKTHNVPITSVRIDAVTPTGSPGNRRLLATAYNVTYTITDIVVSTYCTSSSTRCGSNCAVSDCLDEIQQSTDVDYTTLATIYIRDEDSPTRDDATGGVPRYAIYAAIGAAVVAAALFAAWLRIRHSKADKTRTQNGYSMIDALKN
jgi:hypothetical protein